MRGLWRCARIEGAQIANSIDVHSHANGLHPAAEKRMDVVHRWSQEAPRDLAGNLGECGDLAAARDYTRRAVSICACHGSLLADLKAYAGGALGYSRVAHLSARRSRLGCPDRIARDRPGGSACSAC